MKKIDQTQLRAKHAFEVYKELKTYPSTEDVLYEVFRALEDRDLLDKPFTQDEIWKLCTTRIEGQSLADNLDHFTDLGYFSSQIDGKKKYYKFLAHPWIIDDHVTV